MKVLMVDLDRCNGCFNCQLACKDEHCDNDWRPIARPQPITGQFWCRVNQRERGRAPVVRVSYLPVFCGMCDDAPCMAAAENDAVYRREDGLIVIDPEKAKGQRRIVDACPLGLIYWNEGEGIPQKCTGCAHLLDNGWTEPRCVDACSTGALRFGELEDFEEELDEACVADELEGRGSHVYYLNRPKRWIAGTVANRGENEVVIGAEVSIFDDDGSCVTCIKTDEFGDFRYEQCDESHYRVRIKADGFGPIELAADCTDKDVVFDDVFVDMSR